MRPIFLQGKNINLSPLSKEDSFDNYTSWLNNQETTLYMGSGRFPVTADNLNFWEKLSVS